MHTSGNSSIDTSLIRDIYCGPEVLFETCVATKFVDDDDDDDDDMSLMPQYGVRLIDGS